jgi:hypothetical protein
MSLLDDAQVGPFGGNRCWATHLPDDLTAELSEVEEAHESGTVINQAALSRALKARGFEVTDVGRHLRRECKCRS